MSADPKNPNLWIKTADRLPTADDADFYNEVWFWVPRFAADGPQLDRWNTPEDATYWRPTNDFRNDTPAPPKESS